jgi:hypothetical protein
MAVTKATERLAAASAAVTFTAMLWAGMAGLADHYAKLARGGLVAADAKRDLSHRATGVSSGKGGSVRCAEERDRAG